MQSNAQRADWLVSYNYPGVTNNVVVSPDSYATLAAHKNIVGCKMYVTSFPPLAELTTAIINLTKI